MEQFFHNIQFPVSTYERSVYCDGEVLQEAEPIRFQNGMVMRVLFSNDLLAPVNFQIELPPSFWEAGG